VDFRLVFHSRGVRGCSGALASRIVMASAWIYTERPGSQSNCMSAPWNSFRNALVLWSIHSGSWGLVTVPGFPPTVTRSPRLSFPTSCLVIKLRRLTRRWKQRRTRLLLIWLHGRRASAMAFAPQNSYARSSSRLKSTSSLAIFFPSYFQA